MHSVRHTFVVKLFALLWATNGVLNSEGLVKECCLENNHEPGVPDEELLAEAPIPTTSPSSCFLDSLSIAKKLSVSWSDFDTLFYPINNKHIIESNGNWYLVLHSSSAVVLQDFPRFLFHHNQVF